MSTTRNAKRLNLQQCIRLQQNNFLLSDMTEKYCHDEIIDRIHELQATKSETNKKALISAFNSQDDETPPPLPKEVLEQFAEEILF